MRILHFLQVDFLMTKTQTRVLWVFVLVAVLLSVLDGNPYWGTIYIIFGGVILSTTPFCMRQQSNHGFLLMLPASEAERVAGRFLYGALMLLACACFGAVSMLFVSIKEGMKVPFVVPFYAVFLGMGLFMTGLEYMLLYLVGELKSQQVLGIIRMVPGFILFFAGTAIVGKFQENGVDGLENSGWLLWLVEHPDISSLLVLLFGILLFLLGFVLSVFVVKRKDFA